MIVADTHAWLWWAADKQMLSRPARRATPQVAVSATTMTHFRDPSDRLIAATALTHGVPLVTKDERIQRSGVVATIW